jgi:hypothetical protein
MKSKSWVVRMLLLLSLVALTAACGGAGAGGAGAGGAGGGPVSLATGTFTKTAHKLSVASATLDRHFSADVPYIRVQHLYSGTSGPTGNRIQGSGYVTAVAFRSNSETAGLACPDVTIKMGHTSVTSLTTTFADNVEQGKGPLVTVLQNKQIAVPAGGVGDYVRLNLDTPFYFNGVDDLVVEYIRDGACSATISLQFDYTMPPDQALDTVSPADATGSLMQPPNMQFLFSGGDNAVEYGGANSSNLPFGRPYRTQMLYLASEINGSGPITGIALQANATTTTGSYTYTLRLGHTTLSALTSSFAENYNAGMPSTMVSNGSFTIPAGIPAGEYIWIPFPEAFTYNGQDNLIVDIDVSRGAVLNVIRYTAEVGAGRLLGGPTGSNAASFWSGTSMLNMTFRFNGGKIPAPEKSLESPM